MRLIWMSKREEVDTFTPVGENKEVVMGCQRKFRVEHLGEGQDQRRVHIKV